MPITIADIFKSAQDTISRRNRTNSPLLRLPPKLRKHILGHGFYPGGGEIILACRQIYEDSQEILGFMDGPKILELNCVVHLEHVHIYFKQLDCTKIQELVCGPRFTSIMVAHQSGPNTQGILNKNNKNLLMRFPALKEITFIADLSKHGYFTPEDLVDKKFGLDTVEWGVKINIRKVNEKAANGLASKDRAFRLIRTFIPGGNLYHPAGFSLAKLRARLEGPQYNGSWSLVDRSTSKDSMQTDGKGSPFLSLPVHIRHAIYAHAFSTAHTHPIYNPNSKYMSRCTIVEDGTPLLLVSRQLNAEVTPYKHTYTMLVVSKPLYFPEFVAIKKTAKSDRINTVRLPILMAMAIHATVFGSETREAAWPKDEVVKEAFAGLKCVEVSKDKVSEKERECIYLALTKALAANTGVARAIRIAFCKPDLLVRVYDKARLE